MRGLLYLLLLGGIAQAQTTCVNCAGATSSAGSTNTIQSPSYHVKTVFSENQHIAASTTATVADITGQSGTVVGFQMALCTGTVSCASETGSPNDAIINIYIDGSGTPNVTFDVGVLGCAWTSSGSGGAGNAADTHSAVGWGLNGLSSCNFYLSYPQYFSSEFKVTVTSTSAMTNGLTYWDMVRYSTEYTSTYRLKSSNLTLANASSVNLATQTLTILNLASGSGWLAGFFLDTSSGASNLTYLEANFQIAVNGEGTPSYISSGGEDFFTSGFYFNYSYNSSVTPNSAGIIPAQAPWFYVSEVNTSSGRNTVTASLDFLALEGGHKFDNGVLFQWKADATKAALVTTSVTPGYLCLYYQ